MSGSVPNGGRDRSALMQTFAVTVPPGIGPGQQFQASLDGQLTMVIVPHGSGPNSTLHVQIPIRPSSVQKYAVTIPNNVQQGGRFQANLGGQLVWLTCPRNLGPGKQMLVDASSASAAGASGGTAKSWPPPIGAPADIDGARAPVSARRTPLPRCRPWPVEPNPPHQPRQARRPAGAPDRAPTPRAPPTPGSQIRMSPNISAARSRRASCGSPP